MPRSTRSSGACELGERGGFAYAAIATRADLARVIAYLGDGERALALADEALAIALRAGSSRGLDRARRAGARAHLPREARRRRMRPWTEVDLMMLPEPDRTFLMAASADDAVRLALADGDAEEAETVARQVIGELDRAGCRSSSPSRSSPSRRPRGGGSAREAGAELLDAIELAERFGERRVLWEALSLSGRSSRPAAGRRATPPTSVVGRARSSRRSPPVFPTRDLRARFLAREEVRALRRVVRSRTRTGGRHSARSDRISRRSERFWWAPGDSNPEPAD